MNFDILIIGAGPAGMWATVYAALHNKKICIIESSKYIGGQPMLIYPEKAIDDVPGFIKIRAGNYANNLINQFKHYTKQYKLYLQTYLESFIWNNDEQSYTCFLSNNEKIIVKYIIFSTGIGEYEPKKLTTSSGEIINKPITYIVDNINKFKNKKVVIFGGGDSAVDWANILIEDKITNNVSIVHRTNIFRALPKNLDRLEENKVIKHLNYSLDSMNDEYLHLINNDNESIDLSYDEIICMFGIEPKKHETSYMNLFELKANKFITNRSQQTNVKNIYAIGQACVYDDRANLIIVALSEASIAIKSIINEDIKNRKKQL